MGHRHDLCPNAGGTAGAKRVAKKQKERMKDLRISVTHAGWENEPSYVWGADQVGREVLKGMWAQIDRLFDE